MEPEQFNKDGWWSLILYLEHHSGEPVDDYQTFERLMQDDDLFEWAKKAVRSYDLAVGLSPQAATPDNLRFMGYVETYESLHREKPA